MVPAAKLAELAALADRRGWRVVLVGDPQQFSAVGRGGMFGLTVDTFGAIELDSVHRFAPIPWRTRPESELRHGDVDGFDLYDSHERLHDGASTQMERNAIHRGGDTAKPVTSVVLMAPTNETVAVLNERAQLNWVCALARSTRTVDTPGSPVGESSWATRTPRGTTTAGCAPIAATWSATERRGPWGAHRQRRLGRSHGPQWQRPSSGQLCGRARRVGIRHHRHGRSGSPGRRRHPVPRPPGPTSATSIITAWPVEQPRLRRHDGRGHRRGRAEPVPHDRLDRPARPHPVEPNSPASGRPPSSLNGEQLRQLFGERYDLRSTEDPAPNERSSSGPTRQSGATSICGRRRLTLAAA